jgi:hypothetical protein
VIRGAIAPFAAAAAFLAAGCGGSPDQPDNAAAFADIQSARSGDEVVVDGIVTRVEPSLPGPSGLHEEFDILISSGAAEQDVAIADNISIAESAPLRRGDHVIVKGVLEIDTSGPVIHWTHHDPEFRHAAGFVEVGGKKYD